MDLIRNKEGRANWDSPEGWAKLAETLSALENTPEDETELRHISALLLRRTSMSRLSSRLDWLVSLGSSQVLEEVNAANARRVCGYVFKRGDIAWNCRTCEQDGTCVQCDRCFRQSNHKGHEVFFHRTAPGGCCDCGDVEAWAPAGCCPTHSGEQEGHDPLLQLPPRLRWAAAVVVQEALRCVSEITWDCLLSHEPPDSNPWLTQQRELPEGGKVTVRVHNDDVHTFEYVIDAFTHLSIEIREAVALTQAVDEMGSAVVLTGTAAEARYALAFLRSKSLIGSASPENHVEQEERLSKVLGWLTSLCRRSDGLCRLLGEIFMQELPCDGSVQRLKTSNLVHIEEREGGVLTSTAFFPAFPPMKNTPLALLLAADPAMMKGIRHAAHAFYMRLIVDSSFKMHFAIAYSRLYTHLNRLFWDGIGTQENWVFNLSVQLFTNPRLVRMLADASHQCESPVLCEKSLWCNESAEPGLQAVLVGCLRDAFEKAGAGQQLVNDVFLDHQIITFRRFSAAFHDLEYTLQSPGAAWDVVVGKQNPGPGSSPMGMILGLLTTLQYMDQVSRRTGTHVEFESRRWMGAFQITLSLSSLVEVLIGHAIGVSSTQVTPRVESGRERAALCLSESAVRGLSQWLEKGQGTYLYRETAAHVLPPPPVPLQGGTPRVLFCVQAEYVSLHLPLHRFLARVVLSLAHAGLPLPQLPTASESVQSPGSSLALGLIEHPLRAMVFASQVQTGIWVRNGSLILNQVQKYSAPPICRHMRDMDLVALQFGMLAVGPDVFLTILLERFSLDTWFLAGPDAEQRASSDPHYISPRQYLVLAEECLTLLAVLVTELPHPPGQEGMVQVLRRELVHCLASGPCTHSEASAIPSLPKESSEAMRTQVLEQICTSTSSSNGPRKFDLLPSCAQEYDPTFFHLSKQEHQVAAERVVSKLKQLPTRGKGLPVVAPLLPPHPAFERARKLLLLPGLCAVLRRCIHRCVKRVPSYSSDTLLARAVQLVTLQFHLLASCPHEAPAFFKRALGEGIEGAGQSTVASSGPDAAVGPGSTTGNTGANANSARATDVDAVSVAGNAEPGTPLPCLLALVVEVTKQADSLGARYVEGLQWLLSEFSSRDEGCRVKLHELGVGLASAEGDSAGQEGKDASPAGSALADRKRKAQEQALQAMKSQQAAFAKRMGMDVDDRDNQAEVEPEHAPQCIMCYERTDKPVGYIGFVQRSSTLAAGVAASSHHDQLHQQFIVVGGHGCQLRASPDLNSEKVALVKAGGLCEVLAPDQIGRRVHVVSPVEGWASLYSVDGYVILEPVGAHSWHKWGRQRLQVGMCGHAVHYECWDVYYASLLGTSAANQAFEERINLDVGRGEYFCPLCKGLSNVLVPHLPKSLCTRGASASNSSPDQHSSDDRASMGEVVQWVEGGGLRSSLREHSSVCSALGSEEERELLVKQPLMRFLDSLEEVCRPPWLKHSHSWCPQLMVKSRRRKLQLLQSTLAYTLMCEEVAARGAVAAGADPYGSEVLHPSVAPNARRLLRVIEVACAVLGSDIAEQLANLLSGQEQQAKQEQKQAENGTAEEKDAAREGKHKGNRMCLPLHVVWDSALEGPSTARRVDSFCRASRDFREASEKESTQVDGASMAHEAGQGAQRTPQDEDARLGQGNQEEAGRGMEVADAEDDAQVERKEEEGDKHEDSYWPALDVPLLAWDLPTLAVGIVDMLRTKRDVSRAVQLLCLARLGQILLQPEMCALGMAPSEYAASDGDILLPGAESDTKALELFQEALMTSAGVPKGADAPRGSELLRQAYLSWLPFLRVMLLLLSAAESCDAPLELFRDTSSVGFDSDPLSEVAGGVGEVCAALGVPPIGQMVESSEIMGLLARWGKQFQTTYGRADPAQGWGENGRLLRHRTSRHCQFMNTNSVMLSTSNEDKEVEQSERRGSAASRYMFDAETVGVGGEAQQLGFEIVAEDMDLSENEDGDEEMSEGRIIIQTLVAEAEGEAFDALRWHARDNDNSGNGEVAEMPARRRSIVEGLQQEPVPFLTSLTGTHTATSLSNEKLRSCLYDLSHMGMSGTDHNDLIELPENFTELYAQVKCQHMALNRPDYDPAVCLVCGRVVAAGNKAVRDEPGQRSVGECTLHARECGSGTGMFFLIMRCAVLLMRENRAAYYSSLYVDEHGEEDTHLRRGKPLYLSKHRYRALKQLWLKHQVVMQVSTIRASLDRVIRDGYF